MTVEVLPEGKRSQFSQVRYQFFLDAPFEISNRCCSVFKKQLTAKYTKKTGRKPITAQTASESRLRTQVWLRNGCNAFEAKKQISNPMSFWTEQDVLLYIKLYNTRICSVYGEVLPDGEELCDGASAIGLFDPGITTLKTTGCDRTGCITCGFGAHREKSPNRFELLHDSHPKLYDWIMRGGEFGEDGKWRPKGGLGYWFVLEWCRVHGGINYTYPDSGFYVEKYGNEITEFWLKKNSSWFENNLVRGGGTNGQ